MKAEVSVSILAVLRNQSMIPKWGDLQCEAPKVAFSWFISPITMVYGTYNYSYWGKSKPTNITFGGLT